MSMLTILSILPGIVIFWRAQSVLNHMSQRTHLLIAAGWWMILVGAAGVVVLPFWGITLLRAYAVFWTLVCGYGITLVCERRLPTRHGRHSTHEGS